MFANPVSQQFGILGRMPHQKRSAKTGAEGCGRLCHIHFRSSDLRGVSTDEMIHRLLGRQSGNRGQNTKGIAGEENDVAGLGAQTGDFCVLDELDRIRDPRVFRD